MKPKLKSINEQVVVLVGATSGIGLETAMYMVERGAKVVIVGRSQEGLNDALARVRTHAEVGLMAKSHGSNGQSQGSSINFADVESGAAPVMETDIEDQIIALEADVTNFDQLKSVADQVIQRFGRIDTWANVAAVSEWALFEDTTPDEFHRIIEVNLLGQAYGAMAVLPFLKQQGNGAIIFISSIAGRLPIPYQAAYNASKHGIIGLADTLRQELKHTDIPVSVTTILPASINTPLFEKSRTKLGVEPNPIPPVYDVKMVARAITYAAEHPVRELIVGDSGYMMTFMRRLAPTLTGNIMGASGFRTQRSDQPKSAQDPDNLYHHISGMDQPQGEFTPQTGRISVLTWFSTHPKAKMAVYSGLLAGAGALIGWRIVQERSHRRSWQYKLPRQARKLAKQAGKASNKALRSAGDTMVGLPVISNLPMFHKRSAFERAGDIFVGLWAGITSLSLPFIHRKSWTQRMASRLPDVSMPWNQRTSMVSQLTDRLPDVNLPWNQKASMVDRLTMAQQRKMAVRRINKASDKMMSQMDDQRKEAKKAAAKVVKRAEKAADRATKMANQATDRIDSGSKKAMKTVKTVAKKMPSKDDLKDMTDKRQVVVRRQSLIERLPFGERRETIIEKLPVNK